MITFEELIAPITVKEFKEKYKGKRPFVSRVEKNVHRKKFFSDIISWRKISDYINNNRAVSGLQLIVPDESEPAGQKKICMEKDGLHNNVKRNWTKEPSVEVSYVNEMWKNNSSMILTKASKLSKNISEIAGCIENFYSENFGHVYVADSHFYCSPNKGAVSFECHADHDDNFLIHSIGRVHWKVYARWSEEEKRYTALPEREKTFMIVIEETLGIGDLLYIPKGLFHRAFTQSPRVSISVPVTKGNLSLDRKYYDFSSIYKPLENENESE